MWIAIGSASTACATIILGEEMVKQRTKGLTWVNKGLRRENRNDKADFKAGEAAWVGKLMHKPT